MNLSAITNPPARVDYSTWPALLVLPSLDEVADAVTRHEGVLSVCGNHPPVDFLTIGLNSLAELPATDRVILVAFNGAVTHRQGKKAPFFSGAGIARATGLPLIAISDPTLALDGEIPLAWYAGNQWMPDFPRRLADVLHKIAARLNSRLLLFGGSGGGFAALQLASMIGSRATAFVWNPQTKISDYVAAVAGQYIATAFPEASDRVDSVLASPAAEIPVKLKVLLDELGVPYNVQGTPDNGHGLLYIQNFTDWHLSKHAVPYMRHLELERADGAILRGGNPRHAVWIGQWGHGHEPAPKEVIIAALQGLARGDLPHVVAEELQRAYTNEGSPTPTQQSFSYGAQINEICVDASISGDQIRASASLKSEFGPSRIDASYAFYLNKDGSRLRSRWYEKDNTASFPLPKDTTGYQIQAFARDCFGETLISKPIPLPPGHVID